MDTASEMEELDVDSISLMPDPGSQGPAKLQVFLARYRYHVISCALCSLRFGKLFCSVALTALKDCCQVGFFCVCVFFLFVCFFVCLLFPTQANPVYLT